MPTLRLTWHAIHDERTCPICRAIDGYTWIYTLGADQLNDEIVHPEFGVVWSVQSGSMAHGHRGNCRCHITYDLDLKDLLDRVMKLHDLVLEMIPIPLGVE